MQTDLGARSAALFASLVIVAMNASIATADPPAATDPGAVFRDLRRAAVEDGIERQGFIPLGGIQQFISVRGRHKDAPILLFVHGGPGFTSIPGSYYFLAGWEEYFTVVQWEQRGAGKTFAANPPDAIRPTLTLDRMVADTEDLIAYLRSTYHQSRIILVGQSWGTVLGLKVAQRHPDWLYAYVGISQVVDVPRSEQLGYQAVLASARKAADRKAIAELEAIAPFPDPEHPERNLQNLGVERKWLQHFHGEHWRGEQSFYAHIGRLSPDYSSEDRRARDLGVEFSLKAFWVPLARLRFVDHVRFGCPVVFFQGRHDLVTSSTVLDEWYRRVRAPSRQLVWFEDAAHMVQEEQPARTLQMLIERVLPLVRSRSQ